MCIRDRAYAAVLFEYFSILNRHELVHKSHNTVLDEDLVHKEMRDGTTIPTSIEVYDGDAEFELYYDIECDTDNYQKHIYSAFFQELPINEEIVAEISVSNADGVYYGYTIGIPREFASTLISRLCARYFATSSPIERTISRQYW